MSFPQPTERQAKAIWAGLSALAVALILALAGMVGWGFIWLLQRLSSVLMPMALAVILAYVLEPVVGFFERRKISRFRSVVCVFSLAVVVLLVSGSLILPGLVRQSRNLVSDLPRNISALTSRFQAYVDRTTWLQKLADEFAPPESPSPDAAAANQTGSGDESSITRRESAPNSAAANTNSPGIDPSQTSASTNLPAAASGGIRKPGHFSASDSVLDSLRDYLVIAAKWLGAQLGRVTTLAEFLIGFILVPVYLFYFLMEKDSIVSGWQSRVPITNRAAKREFVFVIQSINDCMLVFFRGQVLVALCVGVLLVIGYTVMGLRYSVLLGVIAGVLGIVPYLGTIISLALALLVVAAQFGDWYHALLVLAIAGGVKLLEDLVISPKIVGERSGLHPLTTIVAVLVGSTLLGGFIGALVASPLTATLRALMLRYVWNKGTEGDNAIPPR